MTVVHVDGASGYAGAEVVRLIAAHPKLRIGVVASNSHAGAPMADAFPSLGPLGVTFADRAHLDQSIAPGDVVVFGGEAEVGAQRVPAFLAAGARVVDLSAAFRLRKLDDYRLWYGFAHPQPALLAEAAYGLPELDAKRIAAARLIANPGCYPTATLLALAPLFDRFGSGIARIVIDAKTGISGAGRLPKSTSLYAEVSGSIRPYGVGGHRHVPEIADQLVQLGCHAPFTFLPHVVPLSRGMLVTCYAWYAACAPAQDQLSAAFRATYDGRALVHVLPAGELPDTRSVARTARASVGVLRAGADLVITACAIDNLGKGAASQAIQNINLMLGHAEELGLDAVAAVA